jgi:hypothetical protein
MVHCRGIFAPIGEQVCDGLYIAFVMKKVKGPALRFAIERAHQPKGKRRLTGKPEFQDKPDKLPKGVKVNPDKPGEYQVKDCLTL